MSTGLSNRSQNVDGGGAVGCGVIEDAWNNLCFYPMNPYDIPETSYFNFAMHMTDVSTVFLKGCVALLKIMMLTMFTLSSVKPVPNLFPVLGRCDRQNRHRPVRYLLRQLPAIRRLAL